MTSDRLTFASVEIDKSYSLTPPPWKKLCHRWSRDQPRPGSLFQRPREEEKRDPGNEVALLRFCISELFVGMPLDLNTNFILHGKWPRTSPIGRRALFVCFS